MTLNLSFDVADCCDNNGTTFIMVTARALTSHQMPSQRTAWNRIGVLLTHTHWTPEQMSNDQQG